MWLYNTDCELTRLRFLVLGFLIFEAIGLVFTFFYVIRPKFNIIAVYSIIELVYYLILNLMPIDAIIAKNQIDRYFETGHCGIDYTLTLSVDAVQQIARLLGSTDDKIKENAQNYFKNHSSYYSESTNCWQQWNLSVKRFWK